MSSVTQPAEATQKYWALELEVAVQFEDDWLRIWHEEIRVA